VKKAPNPIDRHVGSRVRMRRILLGMSQEKLGEALGLTFQQVQKYEKGTNRIGASRLQQISTTLNVPPSFFFDGAPSADDSLPPGATPEAAAEAPSSSYVLDFIASAEGLHLNKAFARIQDAKVRKRIVDLVVSIAGEDEFAAFHARNGKK
jgi:transcriptional regulator with XRE-family HTH domain